MAGTQLEGRPGAVPAGARERDRRADARRNIASILDAAQDCLGRDPTASIADIARAAGVGRVTLYGHFSTRAELVDAVFQRTLSEAGAVLDAVDLAGDPRQALTRLVASSWRILDQHSVLLLAAERELSSERIRARHDGPMSRVQALVSRGQQDGAFRSDLPAQWLTAVFSSALHGAAAEIRAGRLPAADAARVISATLLAAYTPPGTPVPAPSWPAAGASLRAAGPSQPAAGASPAGRPHAQTRADGDRGRSAR
jgi:TetR/AcrR family transcriptional regulator, mexCD-oprJ operon repressor